MMKRTMTDKEIFIKNNNLGAEFDRYLIEHPEFADKIPKGAHIVLLPVDDPDLCKVNREIGSQRMKDGEFVMYVTVEGLTPQKSRLVNPKLETV